MWGSELFKFEFYNNKMDKNEEKSEGGLFFPFYFLRVNMICNGEDKYAEKHIVEFEFGGPNQPIMR